MHAELGIVLSVYVVSPLRVQYVALNVLTNYYRWIYEDMFDSSDDTCEAGLHNDLKTKLVDFKWCLVHEWHISKCSCIDNS